VIEPRRREEREEKHLLLVICYVRFAIGAQIQVPCWQIANRKCFASCSSRLRGSFYFFSIQLIQYSFHSTDSPADKTWMGFKPSSMTAYSSVCVFFAWLARVFGCGPW